MALFFCFSKDPIHWHIIGTLESRRGGVHCLYSTAFTYEMETNILVLGLARWLSW